MGKLLDALDAAASKTAAERANNAEGHKNQFTWEGRGLIQHDIAGVDFNITRTFQLKIEFKKDKNAIVQRLKECLDDAENKNLSNKDNIRAIYNRFKDLNPDDIGNGERNSLTINEFLEGLDFAAGFIYDFNHPVVANAAAAGAVNAAAAAADDGGAVLFSRAAQGKQELPPDDEEIDVSEISSRILKANTTRQYYDEPTDDVGTHRDYGARGSFATAGDAIKNAIATLVKLAGKPGTTMVVKEGDEGTEIILPAKNARKSGSKQAQKSEDRKEIDDIEREMLKENIFGIDGITKVTYKEDAGIVTGKIYGTGGDLIYEFSGTADDQGEWKDLIFKPKVSFNNINTQFYKMEEMALIAISMAAKSNQRLDEPQLNLIIEKDTGPNLILKLFIAASLGLNGCFIDKATQNTFMTEVQRLRGIPDARRTNFEHKLLQRAEAAMLFKEQVKGDTNWNVAYAGEVTRKNISSAAQAHILPCFEREFSEIDKDKFSDESIGAVAEDIQFSKDQYARRVGDTGTGSQVKFDAYQVGVAAKTKRPDIEVASALPPVVTKKRTRGKDNTTRM